MTETKTNKGESRVLKPCVMKVKGSVMGHVGGASIREGPKKEKNVTPGTAQRKTSTIKKFPHWYVKNYRRRYVTAEKVRPRSGKNHGGGNPTNRLGSNVGKNVDALGPEGEVSKRTYQNIQALVRVRKYQGTTLYSPVQGKMGKLVTGESKAANPCKL